MDGEFFLLNSVSGLVYNLLSSPRISRILVESPAPLEASLFGEEGSDKSEQARPSECGSTSRALSMSIPSVLVFRELKE